MEFGSEFGATVWSLGPESGVCVRVWDPSLESGSESGATVWSLGQSLRPHWSLGQSLESQSEFAATVWSLGLGPESGVWDSGSEFG